MSGIYTIRNAITVGYPFVEAVMSTLPIVDEMLINDGGSNDGTLEQLKRIQTFFPEKVQLFHVKDYKSKRYECLDEQLEQLIQKAQGEWILEVQSDEIWRQPQEVRLLIKDVMKNQCNSVRQLRVNAKTGHKLWTVRIVRNIGGIRSRKGGDCFYVEGKQTVPPEFRTEFPFYHFPSCVKQKEKRKRHARFLATATGRGKNKQEIKQFA